MAALHLARLAAQGERQDLVAEADAEQWHLLVEHALDRRHAVAGRRRRIARAVGQEHAVGLVAQDVLGRGGGRHDRDLAAGVGEAAQDVALGAVVDGDHVILGLGELAVALAQRPLGLVPAVGLLGRHLDGEIHAVEAGPVLRDLAQLGNVELAVGRMDHHAAGRAAVADAPRDRPRVDAADARQIVALQPVVERLGRAPVGRLGDVAAQHHAARRRVDALDVLEVGADIADVREGEGDDLPGIGGIGDDLLIAGHRGVEADLAHRVAGGPHALAPKDRAIGQHQRGRGPTRRGVSRAGGLRRSHDEFVRSCNPPSPAREGDLANRAGL